MLFRQNTCKTWNNAFKMFQAFHDVAWFKRFTKLNLFKYAFNVIQNWETDALQILFDGAYFLLAFMVEGDESSRLPRLINSRAVYMSLLLSTALSILMLAAAILFKSPPPQKKKKTPCPTSSSKGMDAPLS